MSFVHLGGLGNRGWRDAVWIAQLRDSLRGEGLGEGGRGLPTEAGEGPCNVVVGASGGQRNPGVIQRRKQGFIQQFVAQTAVEAFKEGILGRLDGCDIVPIKLAIIHEPQDRVRSELRAIACWE